jgi:DNA modification methylase
MASDRKYIGIDPLTVPDLEKMANHFGFKNYKLIQNGSEHYCEEKNSVDLIYTSPPYWNQEQYSKDLTQAYNNGEDYFYNIYWKKTLENAKYMLKPGKWFGLNITIKYPKMIQMAKDVFGDIKEEVKLRTIKNHLHKANSKSPDIDKYEPIYMFINNK